MKIQRKFVYSFLILLVSTVPAYAEACRMGKNAYSEEAIVCECAQLIKREDNNYDLISRRLKCDSDGVRWREVKDNEPAFCFKITNLGLNAQLNNLSRLSQSMAGCSP